MSQFEDRQKGQEAKFAFDAEKKFKAEARRNKLLGLWAAELLSLSGEAAETYEIDVRRSGGAMLAPGTRRSTARTANSVKGSDSSSGGRRWSS